MSPDKEPGFMQYAGDDRPNSGPGDAQGIRDLDAYLSLFAGARGEKVVGEGTTHYLASERAVRLIRRHAPEAKLVAILRNPAERAFSSWLLHVGQGREQLGFEEALAAEEERLARGWSPAWAYRGAGRYGGQLARWLDAFPREQLRVYLLDDLERDPGSVLHDLWGFLGVDPEFRPGIGRWNASGAARSRRVGDFVRREDHVVKRAFRPLLPSRFRQRALDELRRRNLRPVELDPGVRARLLEGYREDVERAGRLIGRDLSFWLQS